MDALTLKRFGRFLVLLAGLSHFTFYPVFSQFISEKILEKTVNDLVRKETGLKYIYSFPIDRTDIRRTASGQQLEIPVFENEALTEPVMSQVLSGKIRVFDPNFRGDVYDVRYLSENELIDTSKILRYMDAGTDTIFILDESGNISLLEQYIQPDFSEISGIFFMENWLLNTGLQLFHKDVVAYLPIRDYYAAGDGTPPLRQRRLLFMVVPSRSFPGSTGKGRGINTGDYELIYRDLSYELNLYNKSYSDYIYRKELDNKISQDEYEEWEYHHFDFFRHFDRDMFLQQILSSALQGELKAFRPDDPSIYLTAGELEQLSQIPRTEINSVIFHEDWYLNRKDLDLEKVVKSLILVRHVNEYDLYTGEFIRTRKDPLAGIQFGL